MAYANSWTNSTPADPCDVTISPAANSFLIAWGITDSTSGADITPSGWTQAYRDSSTFDNAVLQVLYKVATGSETSVRFESAGSNTIIAGCIEFTGIDTTTPLDVTPVTFTSSTGSTTTSLSITPVTNGCDLVFVQGQDDGNSDYSFSFSTTSGTTGAWTTRADQNSGFFNVGVGSATQTTAGALTAQCVSTSGGRLGVLFALRPAAGSKELAAQGAALTLTGGVGGLFRSLISGVFFGGEFFQGGFFGTPAAGGITLSGTGGALTLTGGVATLRVDRRLNGTGTQLTLSGGTATLRKDFRLTATGTQLTLSGGTATLRADRILLGSGGALVLTGGTATMSAGGNKSLDGTGTALTLSGAVALLRVDRILLGVGGTLTLTGGDATMQAGGNKSLDCVGGALVLTGGEASFSTSGGSVASGPTPAGGVTSSKRKKRKVLIGDDLYEVDNLRDVEFLLKRIVRNPEPVKAVKPRKVVTERISTKADPAAPVAVPMASVEVDWNGLYAQLAEQDAAYARALVKAMEAVEEEDIETLILSL